MRLGFVEYTTELRVARAGNRGSVIYGFPQSEDITVQPPKTDNYINGEYFATIIKVRGNQPDLRYLA